LNLPELSFANAAVAVAAVCIAGAYGVVVTALQRRVAGRAVKVSNLPFVVEALGAPVWPAVFATACRTIAVFLMASSLAGPRVQMFRSIARSTIVVCLDTSGSMNATDVAPSRSAAAAAAIRRLAAASAPATKIGLVTFDSAATVLLPPTRDRRALAAAIDAIPSPSGATAIGDALEVAAESLPSDGARLVVLITDGENNRGSDPALAAGRLRAARVPIFAIGIGAKGDEAALRSYAARTGGAYAHAAGAAALQGTLSAVSRSATAEPVQRDASLGFAVFGGALSILVTLAEALGA
jgi:Ca-activated chloride channel family protein